MESTRIGDPNTVLPAAPAESGYPRVAHDVAGLALDYLAPDAFFRLVVGRSTRPAGFCCVPNAHQCVEANKDPAFRAAVNGAAMRLSDSKTLDLARRFLHGVSPLPTLRGADLLIGLAQAAAAEGKRIGFFGGTPDALARLARRLRADIPGCDIGYSVAPPFGDIARTADPHVAEAINRSGIDILFVGLGCPKQEWWMYRHRHLVQPMMVGVGAAFDYVAGTKRPSPDWVHRTGLEWLYRFIQEPRRLWRRYAIDAPNFLWLVLKQKRAYRKRRAPP